MFRDEKAGFVLRHRYDVDIVHSDVKETRRPKGDYGGSDITARDDLYPEDVCYGAPRTPVSMRVSCAEKEQQYLKSGR